MFFSSNEEQQATETTTTIEGPVDASQVAEVLIINEKLAQPKTAETEHFRRDLIAGAALSKCKEYARELLRARVFERNMRKFSVAEYNFLNCINEYAADFDGYGTAETPSGHVYYFNRTNDTSSWKRPEKLEKDIQQGKSARDQTEPWMNCEFLHIHYLQCEKTSMMEQTGCVAEFNKVKECVEQQRR